MNNISLIAAFGAGLASFVSPCIIPLVPVYFASLCGPEILDVKTAPPRKTIFLHSLSFVIGFSLIFIILGVLVGLTNIIINPYSVVVRSIVGGLLIFFGLFMLLSTRIPWLNYETRLSPRLGTSTGYLRSFLTGCIFCIAWTPCISPILGGILTLAWGSQTAWQGGYLLAAYSLGLGLPFLLIGAAFSTLKPVIKRIHQYSSWIYIISGILLVVTGVLLLVNRMTWLIGALS
jgi:cytochrome c-type biogenesis protein